jgi:hypothetical protein
VSLASGATLTRTDSSWVAGNFEKPVDVSATSLSFEIGDTTIYRPVTLTLNGVSAAGSLVAGVSQAGGNHPQLAASNISNTKNVNRYWTLSNNGAAIASYSAVFTFNGSDIQGGASTSSFFAGLYDGTSWSYPALASTSGTSFSLSGLTGFGAFQVGECGVPALVITDPAGVCTPGTVDITSTGVTVGSSANITSLTYWSDSSASVSLSNPTAVGAGTYYIKATNSLGCSTIKPVVAAVFPGTFNSYNHTACDSYTWFGTTYSCSGVFTREYADGNGCASVDTLHLTIHYADTTVSSASACDSYLWSISGQTYTSSGNYTYHLTNADGCDSMMVLSLTINSSPNAGTISGSATICTGASSSLSTNGNAGGVWSSTDVAVASVNSSGLVLGLSAGTATIRYTVTSASCGTQTAEAVVTVNACSTYVSVKAFVQGYYDAGTGLMNPKLYNTSTAGATATDVDSIEIEFRNATTGDLIGNAVATVLKTDGSALAAFPALSGSYYLVVKGHTANIGGTSMPGSILETWSASPVAVGSTANYDFSTGASQAYGSNMASLGGGVYGLFNGDVNQDGMIEAADYSIMENDVLAILFGYYSTDISGDGVVEAADYSLMENNVLQIIFSANPF